MPKPSFNSIDPGHTHLSASAGMAGAMTMPSPASATRSSCARRSTLDGEEEARIVTRARVVVELGGIAGAGTKAVTTEAATASSRASAAAAVDRAMGSC